MQQPMPGMTDTLEFVKNLWGGMYIPGAMPGMPSISGMPGLSNPGLSVEDLDKKIADLKTVESWLNLNLGMLRGTIQALEVQRGTLAALKAMGDSMAQAMNHTGAASDAAMAPFAQFFTQAAQAASAPGASAAPAGSPPSTQAPAPGKAADAGASAAETPNAAMPAAVAWWNLLQEQFRQAVVSAMPAEGGAPPASADATASKGKAAPADPLAGDQPIGASSTGNPASGRRSSRSKADKA